jgi:hypothetical protein
MITRKTLLHHGLLTIALAFFGPGLAAHAAEPTAFELIKEGNRYVGEETKDKVVQIRSEKSVGTLTPNIWYVVFYDVDATFKATEVKFGAGKKMDVKRPTRLFERGSGEDKQLDRKKFNVDSDKALKTAISEPLLANLKLNASQMWLQRGEAGPVWRVKLWAVKLRNPEKDADIGDVFVSADDGKVVRSDLHIDRVD